MGSGINLTYLGNIITAMQPLMQWVLPVVGTALILGRLLSIIKK